MKQQKEKICKYCGEFFISGKQRIKYCSDICKKKARAEYKKDFNIKDYANNKDKIRKGIENWRKNNPDKVKESSKRQRIKDKNRPEIKIKRDAISKIWKTNNPDHQKEYAKKQYYENPSYRIARICRSRITQGLKNQNADKISKSLNLLGCTANFYKKYLENKFQKGMTWDNQGEWEIDHVIPVASFNLINEEEQYKCFNYKNTQPLWKIDNRKKGKQNESKKESIKL